jgi:hypothetical protein
MPSISNSATDHGIGTESHNQTVNIAAVDAGTQLSAARAEGNVRPARAAAVPAAARNQWKLWPFSAARPRMLDEPAAVHIEIMMGYGAGLARLFQISRLVTMC